MRPIRAPCLQMTGPVLPPSSLHDGETPIWVSEAMVDLYRYRLGDRVRLAIGAKDQNFVGGRRMA